jgi:Ser/Thr protein kinase RdoA (MazF antagonist)
LRLVSGPDTVATVVDRSAHPYSRLTPDVVVDSVEALGLASDGRLLALNSYENRVYQVGIDGATPLVVKFYRPGRWSTAAILEEHEFAAELAAAEIPVVAPLARADQTLFEAGGFRYAIYPRQGGRWPELATREDRLRMGRLLGRIHGVGAHRPFSERAELDWRTMGRDSVRFLVGNDWIPPHVLPAYTTLCEDLLRRIAQRFEETSDLARLRLHGDCHPGNVLWTDGPHFVDLDDCMMGPAIQDLWMLLSGQPEESAGQLRDYVDGYAEFADFDWRGLRLVESLRTLRQINYAAWLARRWDDPAFPRAFPWFSEPRYWEQHVLDLREQLAALQEN